MKEGELKLVKLFLHSVSNDWIREWFSLDPSDLTDFVMESTRCGALEFILSSAFPIAEDRKASLHELLIDDIIFVLFEQHKEMDDIDSLLTFLSFKYEDIQIYKLKLTEERGCSFLSRFIKCGIWEVAVKFVQSCFATEEEIIAFYTKFFTSESFGSLFDPLCLLNYPESLRLQKSVECTVSLIKVSNLECLLSSNDLILDACLTIFTQCYLNAFDMDHSIHSNLQDCNINNSKAFFEGIDELLLASTQDDHKKVVELKKQLFTYKSKKLYIPLPLESLHVQINDKYLHSLACEKSPLWHQMIDDFFNWIFASDEKLNDEMKKKFWKLEEILEMENSFN